MTIHLDKIPSLSRKEAMMLLNSMMIDFSQVRLQIKPNGEGAVELINFEGEIIDDVISMLFDIVNKSTSDIQSEIEKLKKTANIAGTKTFHALGYNDNHIEYDLKSSFKEITEVNDLFVKFIKDKQTNKDGQANDLKAEFLDSIGKYKAKKEFELSESDALVTNKLLVDREDEYNRINKSLDEVKNMLKPKSNMLPQVLTAVTLATLTARSARFIYDMISGKKKKETE